MTIIPGVIIKKYTRTPGPRTGLDDIMASILLIHNIFGHQILDSDWSWLRYAHIQILATCLTIYVFFGTLEVLETTTDMTMLAEGYYTFIVIMALISKCLLFINNRYNFREAYLTAKTTLFSFIREVSTETEIFVLKRVKFIVRLLFGVILFPLAFYIFTVMFCYAMGTRVTLSKATSILMPMTSPYYEIGLALHAIFMTYATFVVLVADMWFVYLMFFFCVASDGLVKILHVAREDDDTNDSYAMKLNAAMRRFYVAHVEQIRYFNILLRMYKWPSVIPLCHVLICECLVLLILSQEFSWAFVSFASNMLPTFVELFAYNWYGEEVKTKDINLNLALLNFDWTSMKQKDKKNFFIIVTYMKKEFGVKTAFGNYLSLVTMTSVLKGSYQAFAVMNTVQN